MSAAHQLQQELKTYAEHLPELANETGKFVLIKNGDIIDTFDTYEDALKVGYSRFQLEPFMVKQITPSQQILSFTRDLAFASNQS